MKPIDFPASNKLLGKPDSMTDDECSSLHVYADGRQCISCWQGNWKDRLRFLLTGKLWLWVVSGHTQPPVAVTTEHPFTGNDS